MTRRTSLSERARHDLLRQSCLVRLLLRIADFPVPPVRTRYGAPLEKALLSACSATSSAPLRETGEERVSRRGAEFVAEHAEKCNSAGESLSSHSLLANNHGRLSLAIGFGLADQLADHPGHVPLSE